MNELVTTVEALPLYEATISSLVRTIFWIIVIGYALRAIARISVVYAVNKTHEELKKQQFNAPTHSHQQTHQKSKTPDAEDVDFIEIKD